MKIPILIFANKCDLNHKIDLERVRECVGEAAPGRLVHYQICSGTTGQGLNEGI